MHCNSYNLYVGTKIVFFKLQVKSYLCNQMYRQENIKIIRLDSLVAFMCILIGLLIINNSTGTKSVSHNNQVPSVLIVSQHNAIAGSGVFIHVYQKISVSNKDNFNILGLNRNFLSLDNKTRLKIAHLGSIRRNISNIPVYIFRNYLFPEKSDNPPLQG